MTQAQNYLTDPMPINDRIQVLELRTDSTYGKICLEEETECDECGCNTYCVKKTYGWRYKTKKYYLHQGELLKFSDRTLKSLVYECDEQRTLYNQYKGCKTIQRVAGLLGYLGGFVAMTQLDLDSGEGWEYVMASGGFILMNWIAKTKAPKYYDKLLNGCTPPPDLIVDNHDSSLDLRIGPASAGMGVTLGF